MGKKVTLCPICKEKIMNSKDNSELYNHIETKHSSLLINNITPSQLLFNMKYKKNFGTCVMCGKKTEWNETSGRYNRFCSNECKEDYVKEFKNRMVNTYGREHLLNDPDKQKEMLANRKISGVYEWSDGKSKFTYTGSYELKFLQFLDLFMNWSPLDIIAPAPMIFDYKDESDIDRFYIPDFYILSLNLIVECKDGGDNPNTHHKIQDVDKVKEKIKDDMMNSQKNYNYVKITNNEFNQFLDFLIKLKNNKVDDKKEVLIIMNK